MFYNAKLSQYALVFFSFFSFDLPGSFGEVNFRIKISKNQKITKCPTMSQSNFFNILNGTLIEFLKILKNINFINVSQFLKIDSLIYFFAGSFMDF